VKPGAIPENLLSILKELSGGLLDPYAVLDVNGVIYQYNPPFRQLFPRKTGRELLGSNIADVLPLTLQNDTLLIHKEVAEKQRALRYEEIIGHPVGGETHQLMIAAVPIMYDSDTPLGSFISFRDVSAEASVQEKYQTMSEDEHRRRMRLEKKIKLTEQELVEAYDKLNASQKELLKHRKGLLF
jgi:PAS domain S-box-containing protein